MKILSEQLFLLFTFMLCGFLLGKNKIVNYEHTKILSVLEIYLFLPCTIFNAFYCNFSLSNLSQYYVFIVVSLAVLGVLICFSHIIFEILSKNVYDKNIYKYSLIIPNYGYMGYALAQGLYNSEGLLQMIFFAIPFSFYTYTFGYCMLTNRRISFKSLLNPVILSIIPGVFWGILNIRLPAVFEIFVNKSANCMAPVSMLLTGMIISEFRIKDLIDDKKTYFISFMRLIIIPFIVMIILKQFFDDALVRTAVLLCAMPCGLNTIIFPKLVGKNCLTGAKLAFVSNILAILSIPLLLIFI